MNKKSSTKEVKPKTEFPSYRDELVCERDGKSPAVKIGDNEILCGQCVHDDVFTKMNDTND